MAAATDGAPSGEQLFTRGGPNVPDNRGQSMVRGHGGVEAAVRRGTGRREALPAPRRQAGLWQPALPCAPFAACYRLPSTWRNSRRRRRHGQWNGCTCCCQRWGPPFVRSRCRCFAAGSEPQLKMPCRRAHAAECVCTAAHCLASPSWSLLQGRRPQQVFVGLCPAVGTFADLVVGGSGLNLQPLSSAACRSATGTRSAR